MNPPQIKELRLKLDLSQEQFAAKLGVSATTLSRWERGTHKPLPTFERKLSRLSKKIEHK